MYEYKVNGILRVVDGDTVDADISLGFGISASFRFRLAGIDTDEMFGAGANNKGKAAKAFVEKWFADNIADGNEITVKTYKSSDATVGIGDGAFGRWLGRFYAYSRENGPRNLVVELIENGFAK